MRQATRFEAPKERFVSWKLYSWQKRNLAWTVWRNNGRVVFWSLFIWGKCEHRLVESTQWRRVFLNQVSFVSREEKHVFLPSCCGYGSMNLLSTWKNRDFRGEVNRKQRPKGCEKRTIWESVGGRLSLKPKLKQPHKPFYKLGMARQPHWVVSFGKAYLFGYEPAGYFGGDVGPTKRKMSKKQQKHDINYKSLQKACENHLKHLKPFFQKNKYKPSKPFENQK